MNDMDRRGAFRTALPPVRPRHLFRCVAVDRPVSTFDGNKLFQWFCTLTPVFWLLGALTLCGVLLVLRLLWARWPRGVAANFVCLSWLGIAVVQICTCLLYGIWVGTFWSKLHNISSFAVVGWVFGALIIAAGSAHRLATPRTIRGVTHLGLFIVLLSIVACVLQWLGVAPTIDSTPLALLLPKTPSVAFYTSVNFFGVEDTLGEQATRLVLFFPWYTALGLGALSIAFISALERDARWRWIGMLGGTIGVIFSWSRIAIFCLLAVGGVLAFLRLPRLSRFLLAGVALCGVYGALLAGYDPVGSQDAVQSQINGVRPGSNEARDLIYRLSWEGFLRSPYFGNGLDFPPAHRTEPIAIGSHSTIYGLLYTGGVPTLAAFVIAMGVTIVALLRRLTQLPQGTPEWNGVVTGLGLTFCLALYCKFEALYSLTLPCIVLFAWIGACLPSPPGGDPASRNPV